MRKLKSVAADGGPHTRPDVRASDHPTRCAAGPSCLALLGLESQLFGLCSLFGAVRAAVAVVSHSHVSALLRSTLSLMP